MKSLFIIFIYLATFVILFLLMSLIGLLWDDSYRDIISDRNWFMTYCLFFGWWVPIFPSREYYTHNKDYFNRYL